MSALIPAPERRPPSSPPDPARTLDLLATTLLVVLAIGILYLAREILVPIAIAVLLSFVLSPLVKALRNLGINKQIAVGLVVLSTFLLATGLGAILAKQISDLAADAPKYQATVSEKIHGLQTFAATNPLLHKLNDTIADVAKMRPAPGQNEKPRPAGSSGSTAGRGSAQNASEPQTRGPLPVEIVQPAPGVLTILQAAVGTAASPLATAAFVAIFIVFILMQREDLRNRFIRLVGFGDLQRTTLAMNDAARRLSRYFLAQVLLNTGFGVVVAVVLTIIGVPSAILWGIVALFMRFIPYVGSIGAVIFPMAMAAAAGSGWTMVAETAILFVVLETLVGQVVEPLVYGHHTGISPIAVVASATFWTWLWGPIGLVLATPLTSSSSSWGAMSSGSLSSM
jgi:predicted PurR-regulated permease PerM